MDFQLRLMVVLAFLLGSQSALGQNFDRTYKGNLKVVQTNLKAYASERCSNTIRIQLGDDNLRMQVEWSCSTSPGGSFSANYDRVGNQFYNADGELVGNFNGNRIRLLDGFEEPNEADSMFFNLRDQNNRLYVTIHWQSAAKRQGRLDLLTRAWSGNLGLVR